MVSPFDYGGHCLLPHSEFSVSHAQAPFIRKEILHSAFSSSQGFSGNRWIASVWNKRFVCKKTR